MASKTETRVRKANSPKARPQTRAPAEVKSDDPLYLQVVRALKDEIVSGVHPVGSQLPTEEELCERFSVSRYTIREALRRLREDNLVTSRQGAGTIVVPPRPTDSFVHEVMSINDLVAFATGVRFAIDAIEMIEVDAKLAARLGIASGEEWLSVRGFRHTEGSEFPVCWTEVYINREFAAVGRLLQRHTGPDLSSDRRPVRPEYRRGPSGNRGGTDFTGAGWRPEGQGRYHRARSAAHLQIGHREDRPGRHQHASGCQIPPCDDDAAREGIVRPPRRPTNRRTQRVNGWYVLTRPNSNRRCFRPESDYITVSAAAAAEILMLVTRPVYPGGPSPFQGSWR